MVRPLPPRLLHPLVLPQNFPIDNPHRGGDGSATGTATETATGTATVIDRIASDRTEGTADARIAQPAKTGSNNTKIDNTGAYVMALHVMDPNVMVPNVMVPNVTGLVTVKGDSGRAAIDGLVTTHATEADVMRDKTHAMGMRGGVAKHGMTGSKPGARKERNPKRRGSMRGGWKGGVGGGREARRICTEGRMGTVGRTTMS